MRIFFWPLFLVLLALPAWGWDSNITVPPSAPVVDGLGLLQPGEVSQLEDLLRTIKAKSGVEIAVYITPSLEGRAIEDYSIAVTDKWQLGRKKEDKGLLFLIAPKERKMRFEVGYGLEGELTDAFTRRVLDDTVRPLFRDGRYFDGIVGGIARLQEKVPLGLDAQSIPEQQYSAADGHIPGGLIFVLFLFVIFFPVISMILGLGRRGYIGRSRGYWGGGGWGGGGGGWGGGSSGGWGGGGGGFGGGGSSSSW